MTVEWNRTVTEVVWESQTAPGITWTTVVGGTSSGGGVTVHNDLSGRSAADAHPMSAITDLEPALTDIATAVQAQQGDIGTLQTAVAGKQAADADLTAIAALAPSDDALIQRKAGAWTSRTPAQVKADMSIGVGDVSGLDENTRDVIGTALVAGSGVAVTVDDPGNTITIAVSGVVADAINDGTTTVAPSQNAVFDALALKIANPGGSNDDFLQRKAGVYTNRTVAQVKTDLGIVAPALTLIASAVLGADAASFSFTSIPGTYNHLVVRFVLRQTAAGVSNRQIHLRFNNDSSSIYDTQQLVGNNSSASAAAFSAANVAILGYSPAATATANYASAGVIEIPGYALTTFFKHGTCQTGTDTNGAAANFRSDATSFVWRSTAAINRIDLLPWSNNFLAGSAAYLYGVT